jgi:TRAP-type C4-dicarboxylate transport system permease small subunit
MRILRQWARLPRAFNWVAAAAVAAMMLLTCLDVVLRIFRRPILGTYEMVGLLGAVFAAFSLAYTSLERGHIAVDFLVQKLAPKTQVAIDAVNALVCLVLFGLVTWQCTIYAMDLQASGEVSMTLQAPIHPFVYGIALGFAMLCIVLAMRLAACVRQLSDR